MEKKIDKRIIKSKRAIREAFFSLIKEKSINKVTIKDIAERAEIDRKTFYNYYPSIFVLQNEFENELIDNLDVLFEEVDFSKFVENPDEIFTALGNFLRNNIDYYQVMLSVNFSENLSNKIIGSLKFRIASSFEKGLIKRGIDPQDFDLSIVSEYLASAILGVYYRWIDEGANANFDNLTKNIGDLTLYGVTGFLIKKPSYGVGD